MKTRKRFLSNLTILLFLFFGTTNAQKKFTIVAAANLKIALDSINTVFKIQNPGVNPQITYGASGKFYEQISSGAPFDLFFSADMDYPNQLEKNKMTASKVKMYAVGKLVIWSKKIDPNVKKINSLLEASTRKIAIGNPTTAPYGEKAVESLKFYIGGQGRLMNRELNLQPECRLQRPWSGPHLRTPDREVLPG